MIYVEVFADDVYEIDREGAEPLGAGLLRACKQIYNEAYNAYYEHTIFYLRDTRNGIRWITSISRDRLDKIQDLRFDTAQTEERMLFENACHGNKEQYCLNRLVELLGVKGISLQAGVLKGSVENEDGVKFWSEQPCKDPRPLRRWLTMRSEFTRSPNMPQRHIS